MSRGSSPPRKQSNVTQTLKEGLEALKGFTRTRKKTSAMGDTPHVPDMEPATLSESRGVRYLHLGTPWIQGAMRRSKPLAIELEYVRRMMVWMLFFPPEAIAGDTGLNAVQLGLGAGAITKFCHQVLGMQTTAVELNPTVIAACRTWFDLPDDDERLSVLEMDAALYAANPAHRGTAQVLTVDLYDHDAASPVLDDEAFYLGCRGLLADGGVMTVNLFGRDASFEVSARRIEAAFGTGQVWSLPPNKDGNTIVLAGKNARWPTSGDLAARAENIETRFGFPAHVWARLLQPLPALIGKASRPGP